MSTYSEEHKAYLKKQKQYKLIIVINNEIIKLITIIEFILAPAHIIISGPNATLGREFNIVRYGSITLEINLFHHRRVDVNKPIIVAIRKLNNTS